MAVESRKPIGSMAVVIYRCQRASSVSGLKINVLLVAVAALIDLKIQLKLHIQVGNKFRNILVSFFFSFVAQLKEITPLLKIIHSIFILIYNSNLSQFIEAQLLYNQILSQTDSLPHSRLAFSTISPLFVDRFGRSLRFCQLRIRKPFLIVAEVKMVSNCGEF